MTKKPVILSDKGFKKLIEGAQGAIVIYDADGVVRYASPGIRKITGYSQQELIGKKGRDYVHTEDKEETLKAFREVRSKSGKSKIVSQRLRHKKGHYFWTETKLTNFLKDPDIKGIISSFWDVHQRQLTEKKLLDTQNLLETINKNLSEGIFMGIIGKEFIYANEAFLKMLKYSSYNQLKKVRSLDIISNKGSRKKVLEELKTRGNIKDQELLIQRKDGFKFWGRLNASTTTYKGEKNCFVGNLTDITERKKLEEIAESVKTQLVGVIESTKDEILALDKDHCYTMFNQAHYKAIERLSGDKIKLGDRMLDVLPRKMVPLARREINRAFKGNEFTTEVSIHTGVIVKVSFTAIRDLKGNIIGVALFGEDITKRKITEAKLKTLNKELMTQNLYMAEQEEELKLALDQLSERNFELDQLMYKTSHDLRSPLTSILGLVNLAIIDKGSDNVAEYLVKIEESIKKLDEFISSMLGYAKVNRGEIRVEEIDIKNLIQTCIKELEYLESFQKIKVRLIFDKTEVIFRNDLYRLRIILSNVISNAYKYYNPDVKSFLTIKVKLTQETINIVLTDNGIGIKPEHQKRIFDMFFRATDRSQGSGLGMYIVKQAVEKLEGNIKIKSNVKHGTKIDITIPNR